MKISCTLILLALCLGGYSQQFAPVGAKWHYHQLNARTPYFGTVTIENKGDTTINERTWSRLLESPEPWCNGLTNGPEQLLSQRNDSVWWYNKIDKQAYLLYTYNAAVNDSFGVKLRSDTLDSLFVLAKVTAIGNMTINTQTLRTLSVQYFNGSSPTIWSDSVSSQIVETIGDTHYLMPAYTYNSICDASYGFGLRCYEDTDFGFYQKDPNVPCDYTNVGVNQERVTGNEVRVWPNPANDEVVISPGPDWVRNAEQEIVVKGISGNEVFRYQWPIGAAEVNIETKEFPNGHDTVSVGQFAVPLVVRH